MVRARLMKPSTGVQGGVMMQTRDSRVEQVAIKQKQLSWMGEL